ncbi:MAG TPA: helix-turn-helix domain-containing protein [Streptosporangiaceae bacterium]|nr:helix-turn-helix domain-containing protein [Streptosporangiaceae bacterium]
MDAEVAAAAGSYHAAGAAARGKHLAGMRADARRNYERLLAAAGTAFAERGADDVSLEEIARRAGVGIGTLYRHFPTRQALLESVYRDQVDALETRAAELIQADDPGKSLAEWVAALVTFGKAKRSLTTAMLEVLDKDSELLVSCRAVLCDATDALLERAQQTGAARADVQGTDVIRLAHGVSMAADMGQDPGQADRMLALVLDGLLRADNSKRR